MGAPRPSLGRPHVLIQRRITSLPGEPPAAVLGGAVGAVALGAAVARQPVLAAEACVAGVVLWYLLPRLTLVTAALAGCFFFDDWFTDHFGFWNPGKLVGLLAAASFALAWLIDRRPIVWTRHITVLVGLTGSLLLSYTFARDPGAAHQVAIRYVMFFALFFITLQAIQKRSDIEWIIDVTVAAATFSAVVGLNNFLFHGYPRISGPLANPGDFGFLLGAIVPLLLYRISTSRGLARALRGVALVLIVTAILGTFARADVLGLVAAGVWVLATGRVRVRWAAVALALLALIGLVAFRYRPDLIESSLTQKQHVAQQNVNSRIGLWGVAIDEWRSAPLVGVGPGNYEVRFPEFKSPFRLRIETTHNAYLNVLAELGLIGASLFVLFLVESWLVLRRRPRGKQDDRLMTSLAAGFLVAFVGAMFMTQQFYPPIWFLAALGVALQRASDENEAPRVTA